MDVQFAVETVVLNDYLRYLFPIDEEGCLKVSLIHGMGNLLVAHVSECAERPEKLSGANIVNLAFPKSRMTSDLQKRWLTYSAQDTKRLNAALRTYFYLDFENYYRRAERLNFGKKETVEAFIVSRGLITVDPYESIHKRVYRKEQAKMAALSKILLRKMYYINESLDSTGITI